MVDSSTSRRGDDLSGAMVKLELQSPRYEAVSLSAHKDDGQLGLGYAVVVR